VRDRCAAHHVCVAADEGLHVTAGTVSTMSTIDEPSSGAMASPDPAPRPELELVGPAAAVRRAMLVAGVVLFALGTFGSNIGPAWIDERPELVLALSSRNRNLFGSVPFIDPVPYAVIGFLRVLAAGVVLFFLGRWYGRRAIDWTEGQIGELPAIYRWFQTGIDKAGWLLVLVMPGSNLVCLMAGYRRMSPRRFIPLLVVGIVAKLAVLWAGGKIFEDQIRQFLDWIEQYQWWIVGGLFALSFLQSARRVRTSLPEIVEEIENPGSS
jgi:membrane protein DedA with SNARE-associated domain